MSPETRHEALRRIELTVLRRLDGILQGDHQGLIPGHGSELGESRIYEIGDDVRRIDWNVTARTRQPHVRDTIADRELEVLLVVDLSGSMAFGTRRWEKRDLAISAAAAIGHLAQRGGNRVGGLLLCATDGPVHVPPRTGRRHLQSLVVRMVDAERRDGAVDLTAGFTTAGRVARRRGLVVVASDFLDAGPWWEPLRVLARRHDVVCLETVDPAELALPDIGTIPVGDIETGATRWVDTASPDVRRRFARAAVERAGVVRATIRGAGADHLRLRTDGDWVHDLARHVAVRRRSRYSGRRP